MENLKDYWFGVNGKLYIFYLPESRIEVTILSFIWIKILCEY